jgi:DNA-binding MarR family transcriptional regulator
VLYQRSLDIERRLQAVLRSVETSRYSTPLIAEELGVSISTVSRNVTALRERGHQIRSHRLVDGTWRYGLIRTPVKRRSQVVNGHARKRA